MSKSNKPLEAKQSKQVFPSQTTRAEFQGSQGGGGQTTSQEGFTAEGKEHVISLVHLDLKILKRVKPGERVTVDLSHTPFQVSTNYGRLGDIPAHKEQLVKQKNLVAGSVHKVSVDDIQASVKLKG
jgi:hypothetical protein